MTIDEAVAAAEQNIIEMAPDAVNAAFVALFPAWAAFFVTPGGKILVTIFDAGIKWVAGVIVKFFDNRAYYVYKATVNNAAAAAFEDSVRATRDAIASGDQNAISKSRATQRAAFLKLYPLTA